MRVAQVGNGADIVWVPGGDSPAEAWRLQMMHFAGQYRSTSYDPRGVGETKSDPGALVNRRFCTGLRRID